MTSIFKVPFNGNFFEKYSILDISVFTKGDMFSNFSSASTQLTNISAEIHENMKTL